MNRTAELTRREQEIAEMFAWGASKKEVVMELADEMICKRAKETLDAHVQKKNQTEDNKEESKDNE